MKSPKRHKGMAGNFVHVPVPCAPLVILHSRCSIHRFGLCIAPWKAYMTSKGHRCIYLMGRSRSGEQPQPRSPEHRYPIQPLGVGSRGKCMRSMIQWNELYIKVDRKHETARSHKTYTGRTISDLSLHLTATNAATPFLDGEMHSYNNMSQNT